ncbi:glutathione transferase [Xylophilus rhododendri]|uniref:Glutathione transferase n=1 Tax=Xylophilus rhododendri TaxID=2697032 RepID=A0A857JAD7_9BURK|nr:glutathione transferase [Xylophilus rhododendri]QHJ00965.1 glutathione transferase [Xylophilus rhododendri]
MTLHLHVDSRFTSPYALSVYVALREKGLPFTLSTVDLARDEQHARAFAESSLTQRVPTLTDGDFTLSESSAIVEYLEEAYPQTPVYPRELQARARARQVQAWLRSDLMSIREERSTEGVFYTPVTAPLSPAGLAAVAKLYAGASALLAHGGPHLFGEWCIADTDLAVMLNRLLRHGDAMPERLAEYVRGQWRKESVQAWVVLSRMK